MTTSGPATTYRYVADGRLESEIGRLARARLRKRLVWVGLAIGLLAYGIGASAVTYADSLSTHFGRVILIGVVWGLVLVGVATVVVLGVSLPLIMLVNRRLGRHFARASVTEVALGPDALVIRRPTGVRTMPYPAVLRVRTRGPFLMIERRGRFVPELLPLGLLPDEAVEFIRARSRRTWPASIPLGTGEPTRRMVVPSGWAAHAAIVHTLVTVKRRAFWIRVGAALVVSFALRASAGPGWLMIAPAFALLSVAITYLRARRSIGKVVPSGSVASTEFLDDRFISRNAGGAREIRHDDVRSIEVRGDVVLIQLASQPGRFMIARALFPDEELARLRDVIRGGHPGDQNA